MSSPILVFDNLTLGYRRHPAVHHLCGEVAAGSLLAVVGPNGAGKSTLLKGMAGELLPMQGGLRRIGIERQAIAYLTQQSALDANFPLTVFDLVATGLWRRVGPFRGLSQRDRSEVQDAITVVGLGGLEQRAIGTLSGGQLQRARFARVLLQDAQLILLDEPYAAIDTATARDLSGIVAKWHNQGRTVISILHDLDHVRAAYPEAMLLAREEIARGPSAEVLNADNLQLARSRAEALYADHPAICQRPAAVAANVTESTPGTPARHAA
jgi:zinc/manganese transport system ATP-binding protein